MTTDDMIKTLLVELNQKITQLEKEYSTTETAGKRALKSKSKELEEKIGLVKNRFSRIKSSLLQYSIFQPGDLVKEIKKPELMWREPFKGKVTQLYVSQSYLPCVYVQWFSEFNESGISYPESPFNLEKIES